MEFCDVCPSIQYKSFALCSSGPEIGQILLILQDHKHSTIVEIVVLVEAKHCSISNNITSYRSKGRPGTKNMLSEGTLNCAQID